MYGSMEWRGKSTVILGCGNVLFGDDGFGPAVAETVSNGYEIPDGVCVLNVGSSVREVLFDIALADERPGRIVVVDAVDCDREPGEVFYVTLEDFPARNLSDFSIHQIPTTNLLKELHDLRGIDVVVLACQPGTIPDAVEPGLSPAVEEAVREAGKLIHERYLGGGSK